MEIPIVTIQGNIYAGKTTLLQKFEWSISGADRAMFKTGHETVKVSNFVWK